MKDIIEQMEDCAERRLDEMTRGLPPGKFRCYCGNVDELAHAAPSSDNPYSSPMCRECLDKATKESQ